MNRDDVAHLDPDRMSRALVEEGWEKRWNELVEKVEGDAARLLKLVCCLRPADRIRELRALEIEQDERGAGFYGMLPRQVPDDLQAPEDLESSFAVALRLADVRAANLASLAEVMPQYPLSFSGEEFVAESGRLAPRDWRLELDVSGLQSLLEFFDAPSPDATVARHIASHPAFREMLTHRRNLGYVPEPVIDETGLVWCLLRVASRDPIDEIWTWLHPQNLFDLSDLYAQQAAYRRLIARIVSAGDGLAAEILGAIAPYIPPGVVFEDRFTLAVGWGIRGWATPSTAGLNIEHLKDDFTQLRATAIHETFHRLQTSLCPGNPDRESRDFERITAFPFESCADRRLYEALCYVMLEGSATFVSSSSATELWRGDAEGALSLLSRIDLAAGSGDSDDSADALLNEGVRSNGPFYGFGAFLCESIVTSDGSTALGQALQQGAPAFFERGIRGRTALDLEPHRNLLDRIAHLRHAFEQQRRGR